MRNGLLGAIAALMTGAGLVWAQEPPVLPMPTGGGQPGMGGVTSYPAPLNPEGLMTNDSRRANFWWSAEYLGWYGKRAQTVYPIVTTSSNGQSGILGASTTSVLYSGPNYSDLMSGGRVIGGMFFADDNRFGVEFGGWILGKGGDKYTASSQGNGSPLLAVPFVNTTTGQNSSVLISATNIGPGTVTATSNSQVWGADAHWLLNLYRTDPMSPWGFNLNVFAGLSVFSLRERFDLVTDSDFFNNVQVPFNGQIFTAGQSLTFTRRRLFGFGQNAVFLETTTDTDTVLSNGTVDRYRTSNQFYGGELGLNSQMRFDRWSLGFTGKLSVGVMHTSVEVQGYSTLFQVGTQTIVEQRVNAQGNVISSNTRQSQQIVQQTLPGGIYAVSGRIGRYSDNSFAWMPEGGLTLGYQFSRTLSGSLGYNFLYMSKVVRAPHLINQAVDPRLHTFSDSYGTGTPTSTNFFPYSGYWVQGLTAGLSIQY